MQKFDYSYSSPGAGLDIESALRLKQLKNQMARDGEGEKLPDNVVRDPLTGMLIRLDDNPNSGFDLNTAIGFKSNKLG